MANKVQACYLYSKLNYPMTIQYNNEDLIVPPNAMKFLLADASKVGTLPAGIRKVMIEGVK